MGAYEKLDAALANRYRFDTVLGHGAMGTVYRAADLRLERHVVIKMLDAALTNEVGIKRFEREILVTAGLYHPSILKVYDSGEAEGQLYYVMEDVGGESLRTRLDRETQLTVDETIAIAGSLAAGLQHAHDRGVVHRDIKPENIILADGRAYIVDFGVARIVNDAGSQRLTESGITVGTPEYLSPEQAAGAKGIGPAADQYALACVVFEMLTGEPPFTGPTVASVTMRHTHDTPPSLRVRRPDAPRALREAISRALRKKPEDRFGSVREFMDATSAAFPPRTGLLSILKSLRGRR